MKTKLYFLPLFFIFVSFLSARAQEQQDRMLINQLRDYVKFYNAWQSNPDSMMAEANRDTMAADMVVQSVVMATQEVPVSIVEFFGMTRTDLVIKAVRIKVSMMLLDIDEEAAIAQINFAKREQLVNSLAQYKLYRDRGWRWGKPEQRQWPLPQELMQ